MFRSGLFCVLLLTLAATASARTLRIATEGAYPPFNYFNAQGVLTGFDVEIAQALCKQMGVRCRIEAVAWKKLIPGLISDRYDIVVAGMAKTPERDALVDFTTHYFRSRTGFIGQAGTPGDFTRAGMRNRILATRSGSAQAAYLFAKYGEVAEIRIYPTMPEAYDALSRNEVDLVLTRLIAAFDYLQSENGAELDFVGEALPENEYPFSPAHILVPEGKGELLEDLNRAIQDIRLNGTYDHINRNYFPISIY